MDIGKDIQLQEIKELNYVRNVKFEDAIDAIKQIIDILKQELVNV